MTYWVSRDNLINQVHEQQDSTLGHSAISASLLSRDYSSHPLSELIDCLWSSLKGLEKKGDVARAEEKRRGTYE
jgi:hypothetical protein